MSSHLCLTFPFLSFHSFLYSIRHSSTSLSFIIFTLSFLSCTSWVISLLMILSCLSFSSSYFCKPFSISKLQKHNILFFNWSDIFNRYHLTIFPRFSLSYSTSPCLSLLSEPLLHNCSSYLLLIHISVSHSPSRNYTNTIFFHYWSNIFNP